MIRSYNESLLEDFLRDYPFEFLGERLELYQQQANIAGFRPDLIFKDPNGHYVIVEVQLKALDRNHLFRTLEYRDLVLQRGHSKYPRVILVFNSIPARYEQLTRIHNVECKIIPKIDFLKKARILCPELTIQNDNQFISGDGQKRERLTIQRLLNMLHTKSKDPFKPLDQDALVFWLYPRGSSRDIEIEVAQLDLTSQSGINFPYLNKTTILSKDVGINRHILPHEIIVNRDIFERLSYSDVFNLNIWSDLITHYHISETDDIEIVLAGCGKTLFRTF